MTIKFDTLKKKAKDEITRRINRSSSMNLDGRETGAFLALYEAVVCSPREKPADVMNRWHDAAWAVVDAWDIRKVMELIDLFPNIVPAYLRGCVPQIDYNDDGEWALFWG